MTNQPLKPTQNHPCLNCYGWLDMEPTCRYEKYARTPFVKWKIFTSEDDYMSYVETGKHKG